MRTVLRMWAKSVESWQCLAGQSLVPGYSALHIVLKRIDPGNQEKAMLGFVTALNV